MSKKSAVRMSPGISVTVEGTYRVRLTVEGRRVSIGTFEALADAEAARVIALGEIARGVFVSPSELRAEQKRKMLDARARGQAELAQSVTVEAWAKRWLKDLEASGAAESTIRTYESRLRAHVYPSIGGVALSALRQEQVDALLGTLASDGLRASVGQTLRALYLAAARSGSAGVVVPTLQFNVPKMKVSTSIDASKVATPEQVQAVCEQLPPELALAPLLAAMCALRLGEVLGLQVGDIDGLDSGDMVLRIRRQWNSKMKPPQYAPPKAGSVGEVAVPSFVAKQVRDHVKTYCGQSLESPVFPSPQSSSIPRSQTNFDKAWRKARENVTGLESFRFHDLRHTGLTLYAQQGATPAEILARGRHRSIEIAQRYQHATIERDKANAEKMGEAFLAES
ncbi:site-specific integrase [Pauljensenia sp. OF14-1SRA]|uniref:site-specific integrase n=1 Tax=Pauljensenia sp. OF14-1SRA TaxID=2998062 RepID=UPI0022E7DF5D|nr:site-specific integrase [Pauljensenia sp. OF14-1SRA]